MKIHFENRYFEDEVLIEEFARKIALKNTRRFALIVAFTGIGLMIFTLSMRENIIASVFGIIAILMLTLRLIIPKLLVKKIKKNYKSETGGGENIFRFGNVIHIEQGESKADLDYDMLGKFTELDKGYVFKIGKLSYIILKKGCFTIGDWNGLKDFIKSKRPDINL